MPRVLCANAVPVSALPRSKIAAEEAQRVLKDMVFSRWLAQGCEERSDTLKMVGCLPRASNVSACRMAWWLWSG